MYFIPELLMQRQLKPGEIDTTEMSSLEWQSNYKATKLIKTGICIFPIQHARLNFLRSQTRSVNSKSLAFATGWGGGWIFYGESGCASHLKSYTHRLKWWKIKFILQYRWAYLLFRGSILLCIVHFTLKLIAPFPVSNSFESTLLLISTSIVVLNPFLTD